MALISTGAKLIFDTKKNLAGTNAACTVLTINDPIDEVMDANGWAFPGLQEIGSISIAGSNGAYDQIEVTTLADNRHVYVDGLIADSADDSNEIVCKFLYDPQIFKLFKDILDAETNPGELKNYAYYVISIPEGGYFEIEAGLSSVALETVATNSALTFTVGFGVRAIEMQTGTYSIE